MMQQECRNQALVGHDQNVWYDCLHVVDPQGLALIQMMLPEMKAEEGQKIDASWNSCGRQSVELRGHIVYNNSE